MFNLVMGMGRSAVQTASCALVISAYTLSASAEEPAAVATTEAAAPADAGTPSEEALATARLHFSNGVDLLQESPPNYQDAYRQFQLALEKSNGSWKVRGNLGLCALKLERDGEALAHYSEYLEKGGAEVDPEERAHIEKEILLLKGNLTTVHLSSSEPGARISVSRQGSSAPSQLYALVDGKSDLSLRSGSLTIQAKHDGKTLEWSAILSPGEDTSYTFDFSEKPVAPSEAATGTSSSEEAHEGPSTLRIIGYATAGVGVAALGGGLVAGILSQSKEKKAKDECISDICSTATEDDLDKAKSMATVANILLISGGVLAATGVTLVIVGGKKPSSEAALRLSPVPTLGGGGLFASGHF